MTQSFFDKRLIIVAGAPRSGTTLVQNMLDCHPEILGAPEFLHLPDIIDLRKKLYGSIKREWINLFCSYQEVDDYTRELIRKFLLPLANKHGKKYLSEKTPENVLVLPELVELLPQARFIHMVRDPRAVVASLIRVGDRARQKGVEPAPHARDINAAVACVRQCIKQGFKAQCNNPDKVYTVVFERLVTESEQETKKICDFLNVEWDGAMCSPGEKSHLGESAITTNSGEIWYSKQEYNRNPDIRIATQWRGSLSLSQQALINRSFMDNQDLKSLGYEFNGPRLSFKERIILFLTSFNAKLLAKLRRLHHNRRVKKTA